MCTWKYFLCAEWTIDAHHPFFLYTVYTNILLFLYGVQTPSLHATVMQWVTFNSLQRKLTSEFLFVIISFSLFFQQPNKPWTTPGSTSAASISRTIHCYSQGSKLDHCWKAELGLRWINTTYGLCSCSSSPWCGASHWDRLTVHDHFQHAYPKRTHGHGIPYFLP